MKLPSVNLPSFAAILALLLLAAPAQALDFQNFVGSWRGQGTVTDGESGGERRMQCALTGEEAAPLLLSLTLRCASRQGARTIGIEIEKSDPDTVSRVAVDLPSLRDVRFLVRWNDRRLELQHPDRGEVALERVGAEMELTLTDVAALSGTMTLR